MNFSRKWRDWPRCVYEGDGVAVASAEIYVCSVCTFDSHLFFLFIAFVISVRARPPSCSVSVSKQHTTYVYAFDINISNLRARMQSFFPIWIYFLLWNLRQKKCSTQSKAKEMNWTQNKYFIFANEEKYKRNKPLTAQIVMIVIGKASASTNTLDLVRKISMVGLNWITKLNAHWIRFKRRVNNVFEDKTQFRRNKRLNWIWWRRRWLWINGKQQPT